MSDQDDPVKKFEIVDGKIVPMNNPQGAAAVAMMEQAIEGLFDDPDTEAYLESEAYARSLIGEIALEGPRGVLIHVLHNLVKFVEGDQDFVDEIVSREERREEDEHKD